MKPMPLPEGLSWEVQLIIWAALGLIGALGGMIVFFLLRYIQENDAHHKKVEGKLSDIEKDGTRKNEQFLVLATKIKEEALKIEQSSADMKKAQSDFTVQVNRELLEIHKSTSQIRSDLATGNGSMGVLKRDLEILIDTVEKHQNSLSLGAQALQKQREELSQVKSDVIRITDELIIIKKKT